MSAGNQSGQLIGGQEKEGGEKEKGKGLDDISSCGSLKDFKLLYIDLSQTPLMSDQADARPDGL